MRAAKEAAKLAGAALQKSRKTVSDIKTLTMTPARYLKNLSTVRVVTLLSSKRSSKIQPECGGSPLDSPRDDIPTTPGGVNDKLGLLSQEGKTFLK